MTHDDVIRRAVEWERERCRQAVLDVLPGWCYEADRALEKDITKALADRWNDVPTAAELGIREATRA